MSSRTKNSIPSIPQSTDLSHIQNSRSSLKLLPWLCFVKDILEYGPLSQESEVELLAWVRARARAFESLFRVQRRRARARGPNLILLAVVRTSAIFPEPS